MSLLGELVFQNAQILVAVGDDRHLVSGVLHPSYAFVVRSERLLRLLRIPRRLRPLQLVAP